MKIKLTLLKEHKHSLQFKGAEGTNAYVMKTDLGGEKPTEVYLVTGDELGED